MRSKLKSIGLAVAFATLAAIGSARADPADFYKGKTFEILVGFSVGGGYDAYSRALARAIGKYIPGNPMVIVKNMTGAGSLRMSMFLQDAAPHDGLMIGTMDNGLQVASLLKPDAVAFNASKLTWIGSIAKDANVCSTWSAGRFKGIDDLRQTASAFGVTGRDDIRYMNTAILKNVLGAKIRPISGYPGSTDVRAALERGEIDGECDSWTSLKTTKTDWVNEKRLNILVQMTVEKHPELPDVPLILDLAKTTQEKAALELLLSSQQSGRPYAAPPGIPPDRAQALRRAFDAAMKDPDFLAYTNQTKLEVDPMAGERVETLLRDIYRTPPDVINLARKSIE